MSNHITDFHYDLTDREPDNAYSCAASKSSGSNAFYGRENFVGQPQYPVLGAVGGGFVAILAN